MPSDYERREQERERKWQREYEADKREKERLEEERHAKRMIELERQRRQVASAPSQSQPASPLPTYQQPSQSAPTERQRLYLTLKTVNLGSIAKFGCLWGFIVHGILLGLCILPFAPLAIIASARNGNGLNAVVTMGGIIMAYALASAIVTCIAFTIVAIFFNVVSTVSGGLDFKFEREVWGRYAPTAPQGILPTQTLLKEKAKREATRSIYETD